MSRDIQTDGDNLCREILEEARTEADGRVQQARKEADAILAAITATEEADARKLKDTALQEAARRKDQILASLPADAARLQASRLETLLQSIHDELLHRLLDRNGFDYREALVSPAAFAITRMSGTEFILSLSPDDTATFGPDLPGEIARRTGKADLRIRVLADPSITGGGLIIRNADGSQEWDNCFPARLERLWPEVRLILANSLFGDRAAQETVRLGIP